MSDENKTTAEEIGAIVNETLSPIIESIQQVLNSKVPASPAEPEPPQNETSKGVQDWIEDKRTGGLGGKDLEGPTAHNPRPKAKDPGPTHDSLGKLTGKVV